MIMNPFYIILKALRKVFLKCFGEAREQSQKVISNPDEASEQIYQMLIGDDPCMIARYGSTELTCIVNYLNVRQSKKNALKYVVGADSEWWWNEKIIEQMKQWSGFFPASLENIERFCQLMLDDSSQVDILGSWQKDEQRLSSYMSNCKGKVQLLLLEPFWSSNPWSRALEGKRVLVIHPFAHQMARQYAECRENLFRNEKVLPEFTFLPIQAVQSLGGDCAQFSNWFDALHYMEDEMDKFSYDIVLIGCGAYGFPLAAHAKRTGHKAIHLGGCLQLLFGIRGKRWDNPNYGELTFGKKGLYLNLFNEYWQYPDASLRPQTADKVENGCYW